MMAWKQRPNAPPAQTGNQEPKQLSKPIQGRFATQQEYQERCAIVTAAGNMVWIKIQKIQPARICEVVEYLRHTGDPDGNQWNIALRESAWLSNISVTAGGSGWTTLIMHKDNFAKLKFIDGVMDLARGHWQAEMQGMFAEVDTLNGVRGVVLHALVQISPTNGTLMSLDQPESIDTARLHWCVMQVVRRALKMRQAAMLKLSVIYLTKSKKRISILSCEDRQSREEAQQMIETVTLETQAPPQLVLNGLQYRMVSYDDAENAINPVQEAIHKRWAQEDEATQGRRIVINGIDFEPTPSEVERKLNEYGLRCSPQPKPHITKSHFRNSKGFDVWRAFVTMEDDDMATWMAARGSSIVFGGSPIYCKPTAPRGTRSIRQTLKAEEGPKGRHATHGPTDGLTQKQLEGLATQIKNSTAAQIKEECKDIFDHWKKSLDGAGIDPASPSAPLFKLMQDRLAQLEADVQQLQHQMGAVTLTADTNEIHLTAVVTRCDNMQSTARATKTTLDSTVGQVAIIKRTCDRMQSQIDMLTARARAEAKPQEGAPALDEREPGYASDSESDVDSADSDGDTVMRSTSPVRPRDI
jgi:hypothetical protein